METTTEEIGDGIVRFSTVLAGVPLTFNQFLVDAEEPLLFHCGMRGLFASVSDAVRRVMPLERLRWLSFGHVEADEMGAMNLWLAAAPRAEVLHSPLGCSLSVDDLADRPPHRLAGGESLELGGRRVRMLETPHIPHNWEAIMLFEEVTATLLCGDFGANRRLDRAVVDDEDLTQEALAFEASYPGSSAGTAAAAEIVDGLAALSPQLLAIMHGASFRGDGASVLRGLVDSPFVVQDEV